MRVIRVKFLFYNYAISEAPVRVAMYYANNDVRIEEMEKPSAGQGEMVVRVMASGICGSDVMEWYRRHKVPLVLGHEIAGEVVEVGEGVTFKVGQRVSASHHVPCNTCHYCLRGHDTVCDTLRTTNFHPGGFAEYVLLPEINVDRGVYVLPNEVSYDEGTFIEPLACVLRGQRAAGLKEGDSVLVIGSGISGVLHIALARTFGAKVVVATDINDWRLNNAKEFGADEAFKADSDVPGGFKNLNGDRGADVVILTSGAEAAIEQAFETVDRGGSVLFFAPTRDDSPVPLPVNRLFWRNEITLTSSYAANPLEHLEAMELIRSGRVKVKDMITHRLPLAESEAGFKLVAEAKESIKVIIEPQK
jgi:L-iditol 2-dehydrogenase